MNKMFQNYPDMLCVKNLQQALGIGRNTAYGLLKSGKLHYIKIGSIYKVPKSKLIEYIVKEDESNATL